MNLNRKDPFAFEAPSAPVPAKPEKVLPETSQARDEAYVEPVFAPNAISLTPEAYARLPEELKQAIQARKDKARELTEAFERGYRIRLIKCACAGAFLSLVGCIFLPVCDGLAFLLMAAQGGLSGFLIAKREASPLGGILRYGGGTVAASLAGFIFNFMNWGGARTAFLVWLFSCGIGAVMAIWAKGDRDKYHIY
ncbi:MAG: hypothetical protein HY291_17255 [Planctomycetes bacterium]|nr:hypothetical protein [Planctomycetota bacterium]